MSLMGTLGKVAMGVIVAKGVGKMLGAGGSGGGLGGLLGSLTGGYKASTSTGAGGLGDLLGGLTGQSGGSGLRHTGFTRQRFTRWWVWRHAERCSTGQATNSQQ